MTSGRRTAVWCCTDSLQSLAYTCFSCQEEDDTMENDDDEPYVDALLHWDLQWLKQSLHKFIQFVTTGRPIGPSRGLLDDLLFVGFVLSSLTLDHRSTQSWAPGMFLAFVYGQG